MDIYKLIIEHNGLCWVLLTALIFRILSSLILVSMQKVKAFSAKDDALVATYRIVGCIHHAVQLPLAMYILAAPTFWADRIHAHSPESRVLVIISSGYFLHDFFHALEHHHVQGWGYVIHGAGCGAVYIGTLLLGDARGAPLFHFYGAGFMMWELSSFSVHFRWFFFKLKSSKKLQLINGLVLIASYFLCRIVWGFYLSYLFINDSLTLELSKPYLLMMWGANLSLNVLNCFWFALILQKASEHLRGEQSFGKRD